MPLDPRRIRALCFDVDGTLSDTDDLYARRMARLLGYVPLVRNPEGLARRLVMWSESPGNALLGLTDTIGLDDEAIALINWIYRHRRPRSRQFMLVPGVDGMLARLHERYPMAVISARDEAGTLAFLEQFDLMKYFDVIVTALSAEHTKPYPDPILLAARKMGVPPQTCLMTGDTTVDICAGRAAGAQTVGVLCGFGEEAELRRKGADWILPSTADLADLILAE
jgi:phosphoglycolate phosphatase-like HAD superfamily hydrolase